VNMESKLALQLQSNHQLNLSTEQKKRKLAEIKYKLNQIQQTRINGTKKIENIKNKPRRRATDEFLQIRRKANQIKLQIGTVQIK